MDIKKILNRRFRFGIKLWQALLTFVVFTIVTIYLLISMNTKYAYKYSDQPTPNPTYKTEANQGK